MLEISDAIPFFSIKKRVHTL